MARYARSDQLLTSVAMDGVHLGVFSTKAGGNVSADNTKIRPAAMAAEVSLGGPKTVEDLTVGRPYDAFRDDPIAALAAAKAGSARMVVSVVALDGDGRVFKTGGNPYWTGVLTGVASPDADAGSAEPAMLELTISCDGRG